MLNDCLIGSSGQTICTPNLLAQLSNCGCDSSIVLAVVVVFAFNLFNIFLEEFFSRPVKAYAMGELVHHE